MIPDSFIEELKYASNIEQVIGSYVEIKRRGRNHVGLCPFHSERTPSFTVYPESQSFYCFGCGTGGDVITFIRHIENLDYMEALQQLASRAGLVLPINEQDNQGAQLKKRVLEMNRIAARFFHEQLLSNQGEPARRYLLGRGLSSKTIRTFGVGFAPDRWNDLRDHLSSKGFSLEEQLQSSLVIAGRNSSNYDMFRNRVMFPIIDLRGNIIGFGGRLLEGKGPKYINSPDTPVYKKSRQLFALNFAKESGKDVLILGEGYMDVIAMHQAGFTNSVATLGTALTSEQARLLSQYCKKVVIAYDADQAGQSAAKRAINFFGELGLPVSILQLEDAKDPDEYIQKFGALRFQNLIDGGQSAMDFEIEKLREQHNLSIPEGRVTFLDDFCRLMSEVNNPLQRDVYISEIALELGVSKEPIISTVNSLRKRRHYSKQKQRSRDLATSVSEQVGTDTSRGRHKTNIGGIVAEEMLITMLLKNPDYYDKIAGTLTPDDFTDEGYRQIYRVLQQRLEENLPIEIIHFSSELPSSLMGKLSQLVIKGSSLSFYSSQVAEYITAIKQDKNKKTAQDVANMSPEEYTEYMANLKAGKV